MYLRSSLIIIIWLFGQKFTAYCHFRNIKENVHLFLFKELRKDFYEKTAFMGGFKNKHFLKVCRRKNNMHINRQTIWHTPYMKEGICSKTIPCKKLKELPGRGLLLLLLFFFYYHLLTFTGGRTLCITNL